MDKIQQLEKEVETLKRQVLKLSNAAPHYRFRLGEGRIVKMRWYQIALRRLGF